MYGGESKKWKAILTCIPLPGPIWLIWLKFVGADIILERLSVGRTDLFPSLNENLLRGLVICLPLASNGVKFSSSPIMPYEIYIMLLGTFYDYYYRENMYSR